MEEEKQDTVGDGGRNCVNRPAARPAGRVRADRVLPKSAIFLLPPREKVASTAFPCSPDEGK